MPSSLLFASSSEGRVYTLSTSSAGWREFPYLGLEFKKISAVPNFMWAIGGDRQVYVHVHLLDVPIRVKEESYENERWLPSIGFSKMLLPTDRFKYSSADGGQDRSVDKIRLPSMAWQWDGDWHLDLELDGQQLPEDGWMYALDFPASYSVKKSWNSYVRRRKWIRFRRYAALNSWCAVAPLHKDPTQEPFIDVSIGGMSVPNAAPGTFCVWAITAHGRAMFRTGVTSSAPEGLRWTAINTPSGSELTQISVGPTGLVWAVLYNGRVIVRTGVTRDNLSGEAWLDVKTPTVSGSSPAPNGGLRVVQVSVGMDAVWCVTNDHHAWFRRGIKGDAAGISEDAAIGKGWVEMVGNIAMISVAPNDQVFAVGASDRALYFRSGVTSADPTGKKWRQIQCSMQISRTSSSISIVSHKSGSSSTPGSKHQSFSNLYSKEKEKGVVETCAAIETIVHSSASSSNGTVSRLKNDRWNVSCDSPPTNIGSLNLNERHKRRTAVSLRESVHASSAPVADVTVISGKFETQLKNPRAWSPVRSVGSVVGTEAHPESDSAVFESDSTMHHGSDAFLGDDDDDHAGSQFWTECEIMWSCVASGAVSVDTNNIPNWFNEQQFAGDGKVDVNANWRKDILTKLTRRQEDLAKLEQTQRFEKAVELSSWIKSADARYQRPGGEYEDCVIELEWVSSNTDSSTSGSDSGTFTVVNPDGASTKIQFSLSDITCVQCCSEPSAPRLAIHASHLPVNCSPVKLQFPSDAEMEDWLSHLSSVCSQINVLMGKPANNAIWVTSELGDVFAFDAANMRAQQMEDSSKGSSGYVERMDVSTCETPYNNTLYNGMPCGTELTISGCVYDDADQIRFDLQCHSNIKVLPHRVDKFRVIALHLNPRFNERTTVLNSMNNSEWMDEIRNDKMVFAPGATFTLKMRALESYYQILVNDEPYANYKYRTDPESVSCLYVSGRVKIFNLHYRSPTPIISLKHMYWRQIGGHIRRVYNSGVGVVWGIACDNTAWVYNGGWGGSFLKGLEGSGKINVMIDSHMYYVYENQRWNPISGFTTKSLPTDRHLWSDASGRQKRSKEHTKLFSTHCQWISDWAIDYNIPGGADKEGWQYAIDFPASYHGQKKLTDCVRRRRWVKKCRLTSSGPWHELSHSKILDAALQVLDDDADSTKDDEDVPITAWAIASNGDVLIRHGVTASNPRGDSWEHIASEQPLIGITVAPSGQVWTVARNGMVFYRYGISNLNRAGDAWEQVVAPSGVTFKAISAGRLGIWALDNQNRLAVRREITKTFPEGSNWQFLPNVDCGFRSVSVGSEVWAVMCNGVICKRCGITKDNPAGVGWNLGIAGQWTHVSVEGYM
ncbi:tectonin beta-propeller repeat-containing protein [Scaptodrosophila lebanonensis]|uniref:Tectonin beta-propeller repeat-containing protein n=1 Tax=Drosophila lebanonensis TaxID=7225 RepID=A0A6J2UD29_DROLE|nr:tectonin beta-propeller repeat-containing protein [Scaptodrosophila lebanonensis]